MHIGILTACYGSVVNGVTQIVALHEKYLVAAGHQVTIFTLGQPATEQTNGRVIRSPGIPLGRTGYHLAAGYGRIARRRLSNVDILHCHHLLMGLEFGRRYSSRPIVFTNHTRYDLYLNSYGHVPLWLSERLMGPAWRRLTQMADAVIAPSKSLAVLLRESGVRRPIEVIENGVELERFQRRSHHLERGHLSIPEEAMVFVYVGRIAREKNIRRLVDEFQTIATRRDDAYLLVVGGGPLLQVTKHALADAGLDRWTRFVGPVRPEQVPAYLAVADVFVSASVTEVHPLTVIEAMAAGLPVVAFDSPGMSDIVDDGVSGLLVDQSKGTLSLAMSKLAGDHLLRKHLANSAQTAARQYDIQNNVERTLSLYRRLIRRHHARASAAKTANVVQVPDSQQRRSRFDKALRNRVGRGQGITHG